MNSKHPQQCSKISSAPEAITEVQSFTPLFISQGQALIHPCTAVCCEFPPTGFKQSACTLCNNANTSSGTD